MTDLFKLFKILCTAKKRLQLEEQKLKKIKKDCIHQLMLQYLESIKDTHEFDEIKEQLKCKRKFYTRFCDLYIKDPMTGYIDGTTEYNIINILNDIDKGYIKPVNIILIFHTIISTIIMLILLCRCW
jgi:hypothetical protein